MHTLFKYELKKILKRKSTVISLAFAFLCIVLLIVLFVSESSCVDAKGNTITGISAIRLKREQVSKFEGYLTTKKLASVFKEYQTVRNDSQNHTTISGGEPCLSDEAWGKYIEKSEGIMDLIRRAYSPAKTYDYYITSSLLVEDMASFYTVRRDKVTEILNMDYSYGNFSEAEKLYITDKNSEIRTPFYFSYTDGWDIILTRGFQTLLLIVGLVMCVCISPLFSLEYQTRADSIILSSKYGKNKAITAKISAGLAFATILYFSLVIFFTGLMLCLYGINGWNASFQTISFTSFYSLTISQVYLCGVAIGYLVMLSVMAITMLLSARLKTSFAVVIISFLWLLVPMFIPGSKTSQIFNHIIGLLPANAMHAFKVFSLYDTYNLFGNIVSLPSFIVMLACIITIISIPFAYMGFRKHQVV